MAVILERHGIKACYLGRGDAPAMAPFQPHEDWDQGGPIAHRALIAMEPEQPGHWYARHRVTKHIGRGPTPLIAAMRAKVASIYGECVPDDHAPA